MPEMTEEPLCTTGPATERRRQRATTPSSTTESSSRARAAPRQKWGPCPSATWWLGDRSTSEGPGAGPELGLIAVGGGVDQEHRVAGRDGGAAQLGVRHGGAQERGDRGGPAQDLLDRGGDQRGVGREPIELVGMLGEGDERAGDGVPRGLVAGHEELDQEHAQLVVRQGLAVLLVGRQHRDDVVARLRPSGRGEGEELDGHLPEQGHAVVLRPVGGAGDGGLRPAEEPLLVARGQPEQLGDELDGERDRQLGGDVHDRAALRLGGQRVEGGTRALADEHLELAHDLVREPRSRQLAVAGVLRRVGVHHRRRGVVGDADLVDEDPARRAEAGGIARRLAHVRVAGDGPEALGAVPRQGCLGAQTVQHGVEVAGVGGGVEQGVGEGLVRAGHGRETYGMR